MIKEGRKIVKKEMVKKKIKGVSVKKATKKRQKSFKGLLQEEIDFILRRVNLHAEGDPDLHVIYIDNDVALIVKRKTVTINMSVNPNSMQPYEIKKEKVFFDIFLLEWGDPLAKTIIFGRKLIDMKIEVYSVHHKFTDIEWLLLSA